MIALQTRTAPADAKGIAEAARLLKSGALVAFPTETVYGLGADATNGEAVAAIFAAKGRPLFNPLIVHVTDLEEARRYVELSPRAQALAQKFWPSALTLVLPEPAGRSLEDMPASAREPSPRPLRVADQASAP